MCIGDYDVSLVIIIEITNGKWLLYECRVHSQSICFDNNEIKSSQVYGDIIVPRASDDDIQYAVIVQVNNSYLGQSKSSEGAILFSQAEI